MDMGWEITGKCYDIIQYKAKYCIIAHFIVSTFCVFIFLSGKTTIIEFYLAYPYFFLCQGHSNKAKPSDIWTSSLSCGAACFDCRAVARQVQPVTPHCWTPRASRRQPIQICSSPLCNHHIGGAPFNTRLLHVNNVIFNVARCLRRSEGE